MMVTFPIDLLYEYFLAISKRLQLSFFTFRFTPSSVEEETNSFLSFYDFYKLKNASDFYKSKNDKKVVYIIDENGHRSFTNNDILANNSFVVLREMYGHEERYPYLDRVAKSLYFSYVDINVIDNVNLLFDLLMDIGC